MKNKGLTIIELLVALAIFAIVSVAIYSTFSAGILGWKRGESAVSLFHEIRLSLDRIANEMRNQTTYNGVKLVGVADELYFISLVPYPEEGKAEYKRLARIRYFLEEGEEGSSLFRERVWVPFMEGQEETDKMRLVSRIKFFDFQYGEKEIEEDKVTLTWHEAWEDKEGNPSAVKISLNIEGENPESLTRVVYLPQGEEL